MQFVTLANFIPLVENLFLTQRSLFVNASSLLGIHFVPINHLTTPKEVIRVSRVHTQMFQTRQAVCRASFPVEWIINFRFSRKYLMTRLAVCSSWHEGNKHTVSPLYWEEYSVYNHFHANKILQNLNFCQFLKKC